MQRIYPITEDNCRPHCGKPVLIFLNDGTEIQGILSRVRDGKLYMNEKSDTDKPSQASTRSKKKVTIKSAKPGKKKGRKPNVGVAAAEPGPLDNGYSNGYGYGPGPGYGFGYGLGPPFALNLTTIAALFVLV